MRHSLTLCPSCERYCDQCRQPLRVFAYCPPCAGRKGGASRSPKKQASSRRNIEQTRLMQAKRRRERESVTGSQ
jgi:hypothetical protein